MFSLPTLRQLRKPELLAQYASAYAKCSGLPIPEQYLQHPDNKVLAVFDRERLIGGFILGRGPDLRTLELFAQPAARDQVRAQFSEERECTEICCFWMDRKYRRKTLFNYFSWSAMALSLSWYSRQQIVFGTCSPGLARLYATSQRAQLIHQDKVKDEPTFIFVAGKHTCLPGIFNIVRHKFRKRYGNYWKLSFQKIKPYF